VDYCVARVLSTTVVSAEFGVLILHLTRKFGVLTVGFGVLTANTTAE